MADDDYAPFPEAELTAMADFFEAFGNSFHESYDQKRGQRNAEALERAAEERWKMAAVLRNAVKSHNAVRERMLIGELRAQHGEGASA